MTAEYGDIQIDLPNVNYQKQPGRIQLSMTYVLWLPELVGEKLVLQIERIKNQKISPDGKSKVQIQLQMNDGKAHAFHFTDNTPPGKAKELRNKVKIHLSKLLGKVTTKKVDKVFEERKKILQENKEILSLYKDLVTTKMITPEEFWSSRAHMLKTSDPQDVGVAGDFLSEVKPQSDGSNSIKYNLTPEMVKIIFRTYPEVKAKFLEVCPTEMSERDFWAKFFQSQYFHRDRLPNAKDSSIFNGCDDAQAERALSFERNAMVDLESIFDMDYVNETSKEHLEKRQEELEKQRIKDKKHKATINQRESNRTLIKRFNHHSSLVLRSCQKAADGPSSSKKFKEAVREQFIENNDLRDDQSAANVAINIKNKLTYFDGKFGENKNSMLAKLKDRQRKSCIDKFRRATTDYCPRINETIANAQGEFPQVLIELMQDQKKESTSFDLEPNADVEGAMLKLKEILTHFWSCFSDGRFKPDMEEKVNRMNQNLNHFEENTMRDLRESEGERSDVIQMSEMIEEANQKFIKLQEANAKRKRKI